MADLASSPIKIQQEQTSFRDPVSESLMQDIGASVNFLLDQIQPVGSIDWSVLDEATYQAQRYGSATWVLADGRDVTGSTYASLKSPTLIDLRGKFVRGKNNGGSGAGFNPDGNVATGTYQASANLAHNHSGSKATLWLTQIFSPITFPENSISNLDIHHNVPAVEHGDIIDFFIATDGISESRPINVTLNAFVRIN